MRLSEDERQLSETAGSGCNFPTVMNSHGSYYLSIILTDKHINQVVYFFLSIFNKNSLPSSKPSSVHGIF